MNSVERQLIVGSRAVRTFCERRMAQSVGADITETSLKGRLGRTKGCVCPRATGVVELKRHVVGSSWCDSTWQVIAPTTPLHDRSNTPKSLSTFDYPLIPLSVLTRMAPANVSMSIQPA